MEISMKLVYQYMAIFFTFLPTSNHPHSLQVVVDEDDNVKSGLKGLKQDSIVVLSDERVNIIG